MKLVIGNKNYSSWSLRAWLLLEYYQQNFEEQRIVLFADDMREHMENLCPNYKVPVLLDKGLKVWDSLAICEYVNEQYLENKAWPKDIQKRAHARSISAEMHSSFMSLRHDLPMNCRRTPSALSLSENTLIDIQRMIDIWLNCLIQNKSEGGFLFGEFSIADAMFMPAVSRFNSYCIEVPEQVKTYMQLMLNLPAYKKWQMAAHAEVEVIEEEEV
ncbi:glutathione S-transferase family protein [Pseudoalteromonas denitrificans]|uniref:Glutathione S-transferase n=1 Tax=Pseudoalteromonas denitrificans DSM 6059 TaxID=1123010 RepID=A0A1I1T1S7_9GAMM|nr:glutathione S-transferase family protein [Pseudoalteromonas denitrificans]SFD49230.1 glutathione S-transferase [Pseudoalteromonas denitrificans DSM 6059]